jgi:hypothetical protein
MASVASVMSSVGLVSRSLAAGVLALFGICLSLDWGTAGPKHRSESNARHARHAISFWYDRLALRTGLFSALRIFEIIAGTKFTSRMSRFGHGSKSNSLKKKRQQVANDIAVKFPGH